MAHYVTITTPTSIHLIDEEVEYIFALNAGHTVLLRSHFMEGVQILFDLPAVKSDMEACKRQTRLALHKAVYQHVVLWRWAFSKAIAAHHPELEFMEVETLSTSPDSADEPPTDPLMSKVAYFLEQTATSSHVRVFTEPGRRTVIIRAYNNPPDMSPDRLNHWFSEFGQVAVIAATGLDEFAFEITE